MQAGLPCLGEALIQHRGVGGDIFCNNAAQFRRSSDEKIAMQPGKQRGRRVWRPLETIEPA
jgi:hypothetical protein